MTKKERIEAVILGEHVDRIPYSLWSHLPGRVEDFGVKVDYSEIEKGGVAKIVDTPVKTPEDWEKVTSVSVNEGALAREQKYLRLLLDKTQGEVPVVFTIFSPLTTASKLCPDRKATENA